MGKTEYSIIFSRNLKFYMLNNQKTQADLSKDLKISRATISSWCNGTRVPRPEKVDMLCNYFNIRRSDLMEPAVTKLKTTTFGKMPIDPQKSYIDDFYNSSPAELKEQVYLYCKFIKDHGLFKKQDDSISSKNND